MTLSNCLGRSGRALVFLLAMMAGYAATGEPSALAQSSRTVRPQAVEPPELDTEDGDDSDEPLSPDAVTPGTDGSLVFHGNYCGPGSRGTGRAPIDALDEACMHHDACSPPVGTGLPSCGCNLRLQREAASVARDPRTPDDVRAAAQFVAEGAKVLACAR